MSPFDFVNQINYGKKNLIDENPELERQYKQFIINRALSFNHDTVLYANEMNVKNHVDSKLQFDFFLNTIRPKKRYGKWLKRENNGILDGDVIAIKKILRQLDSKDRNNCHEQLNRVQSIPLQTGLGKHY